MEHPCLRPAVHIQYIRKQQGLTFKMIIHEGIDRPERVEEHENCPVSLLTIPSLMTPQSLRNRVTNGCETVYLIIQDSTGLPPYPQGLSLLRSSYRSRPHLPVQFPRIQRHPDDPLPFLPFFITPGQVPAISRFL